MAMELYQIIYDIEDVPISDKRYNKFIINVFKLFSSDPLKNSKVQCAVKTCTSNFNDFEPYKKLNKKEMQSCSHTFEDENETKQRYLLQYWFLNFCKFIYIMLLNSEIQQQMSDNLFYEDHKDLVDRKFIKVSQIKEKSNELVHQRIQKQSRKKQAVDSILKNLSSSMNQMTKEERSILKDACTVINLMNNPLIKFIVVEKPQMFINYKVDVEMNNSLNKIYEVDLQKQLLINELAQKIIHNYRNEILSIKKKKYITFMNFQKGYQEFKQIFDEEDEQSILRNLEIRIQEQKVTQNQRQGILTEDLTSRSKNTILQLKEDDSLTNQRSSELIQIKDQSSLHQKSYIQQAASSASDRQTSAQNIEISNQENNLYLNQIDALKYVLNVLNEKKNVEIVGKYENQLAKNPEKNDQMLIYHEQRKKLKKQMSQFDSSYNISPETREMFHQEINKKIPIDIQINLYKQLKKFESMDDVKLFEKQDNQFQFFNSAKQLIQGIEDKISNIQIEYFKLQRSQHILEIPILFKFMENNLICLKGLKVNFEHAVAIKQTLIDQQVLFNDQKQKGKVEDNPFIIKTLIINDCSMTDEVFEQILIGIHNQNSIKNIHYTNNNILGDKSAVLLCEILKRNQPKNKLVELHLSNIKIKDTIRKDCPGALAQIMMQVDDTKLLSRLRISDINLRQDKVTIKYIVSTIETFGFELQYLNFQNCNINIEDLARISAHLITCEKLQVLDLSWNQFPIYCTQSQMASIDIFVNNLCAFISLPTSSLKFLDISGFQFQSQHLLKIIQAVQKNSILMSVNFGNLQNKENRKLIKQEFQIEDVEQGFLMKNKNEYKQIITEKIKFKDFYINTGLLRRQKKDQQIAESTLFKKPLMQQCEMEAKILLQRYSFNQELLMNPGTLMGQLDINQSQKWFIQSECYYFNRYRYSLVFFNQKDIDSNNFQILDKQKEFMNYIDKFLGGSKNKQFKGPIIVVNGQIYKMLDAVIFACFLQINSIVNEVKHLLSLKISQLEINNKSAESAKNNSKKQNGEKNKQNLQEHLNIALKSMDEITLKELLVRMNEYTLTSLDIEKMNEDQQNIASLFEGFNWERCIDENLIEKNKKFISVINPQQIKIYKQIQTNIDELKQNNSITKLNLTQNSEIVPKLLKLQDKPENVKVHSPIVYVFAGYLPPGKNTIYIYDRERKTVFTKEVIVEMMSSESGRVGGDWMLNPTFPYSPRQIDKNHIAQ